MKKRTFPSPLSRLVFITLFGLLAMGACKSKKKVVAETLPAVVEKVEPVPVSRPVQPSVEEVAVGKLEDHFASITNANSTQASNSTIQEVLGMFSNQETPVLIVIHEENGIKDYDEPTTIAKYLNYLKDTKKNLNFISDIRIDESGRVSELELRRK